MKNNQYILALLVCFGLTSCTVTQMSMKEDGSKKSTVVTFDPDLRTIMESKFATPTVKVTK